MSAADYCRGAAEHLGFKYEERENHPDLILCEGAPPVCGGGFHWIDEYGYRVGQCTLNLDGTCSIHGTDPCPIESEL